MLINYIRFTFVLAACQIQRVFSVPLCNGAKISKLSDIQDWFADVNHTVTLAVQRLQIAEWNWMVNMTPRNKAAKLNGRVELAAIKKRIWSQAACFDCKKANCSKVEIRRLDSFKNIGVYALPPNAFKKFERIKAALLDIYSTGKSCYRGCFDDDMLKVEDTFAIDDFCRDQFHWAALNNGIGMEMRKYYPDYVKLLNKAAKINDFPSAKDMWSLNFINDDKTYYAQIEQAFSDIMPFYKQLHRYALTKLEGLIGSEKLPKTGQIPDNLIWSMHFGYLMKPYPDVYLDDMYTLRQKAGWDDKELFREADRFFQSVGFEPMTQEFWNNSIFSMERPSTKMECHPYAMDMFKQNDFRMVMCHPDVEVIHHEMGHNQYYMQYRHQPIEFRKGANPGFHEAIGDLISLSATTPSHLYTLGLLPSEYVEDEKSWLNFLMEVALLRFTHLPMTYLVDKYRWDIFEGRIDSSELNAAWWKLKCEYQGASPPLPRTEQHFDVGSTYHVPASETYMRYFWAGIAQFQFHRRICGKIGFTKDFHKCDIYNNTVATADLRNAMALGLSKPYPEVMKLLAGTPHLSASAVLDYFQPLHDWLIEQNKGHAVGWNTECPRVVRNYCSYNSFLSRLAPPCSSAPTTGQSQTLEMVFLFGLTEMTRSRLM